MGRLRSGVSTALVAVAVLLTSPASASRKLPYTTTIKCGEIMTARLTLGPRAQMCEPGLDAIPAFTDIRSYEAYYKVDGDQSCDENCLRPIYNEMRRDGRMHPLISGDPVTVLAVTRDPDDAHYQVCRVKAARGRWLILCLALADYPD